MSFDHPLALLSLVALLALGVGYLYARRRRARFAVSFTNLEVLRGVAPRMSPWRERAVALAAFAALALLVVGVASPHVMRNAPVENATVVLVVDTSRSMLATDVAPTRLGAAKAAAATFLGRVEDRIRVGLVTFSGDVTVAASPTHDRALLRQSVAAINPFTGGRGTAIGDALARAVELARRSFAEPGAAPPASGPIPGGEGAISILFLSDGRQNRASSCRTPARRSLLTRRSPFTRSRSGRTTRTTRTPGRSAVSTARRTGRHSARSRGRPAASTSPRARRARSPRRTRIWGRVSAGSGGART